jgi:hypothetical protein
MTGSWRPFSGRGVGIDLAHHVDQRIAARDQQALLAIGREAHVARSSAMACGDGDASSPVHFM